MSPTSFCVNVDAETAKLCVKLDRVLWDSPEPELQPPPVNVVGEGRPWAGSRLPFKSNYYNSEGYKLL